MFIEILIKLTANKLLLLCAEITGKSIKSRISIGSDL